MAENTTTAVEIVEIATGEVVESIDVSGMDKRSISRMEMGMLINMDRERFFTRWVQIDTYHDVIVMICILSFSDILCHYDLQ